MSRPGGSAARPWIALVGAVVLVLSGAVPSSTAPAAEAASGPTGRTGVGDSVMFAAKPYLTRAGFSINAQVGRPWGSVYSVMSSFGTRLGRNVVIHLGTNGPFTLTQCKDAIRRAGPSRRVFLVTNQLPETRRYAYEDANNRVIRACDAAFSAGRVKVIDWQRFSDANRWVLCPDGMHVSCGGAWRYAKLVRRSVELRGLPD